MVVSDESWKAAFGPIRHADLLMGCELDNRLAMPGWDAPGFDDHAWVPVSIQKATYGRADSDGGAVMKLQALGGTFASHPGTEGHPGH